MIPERQHEHIPLRRSKRINKEKAPERLIETAYMVITNQVEPKTVKETLSSENSKEWIKAMDKEMESLRNNQTWTLSTLPQKNTAIGSKWNI